VVRRIATGYAVPPGQGPTPKLRSNGPQTAIFRVPNYYIPTIYPFGVAGREPSVGSERAGELPQVLRSLHSATGVHYCPSRRTSALSVSRRSLVSTPNSLETNFYLILG
jgi:hypothetical protein